MRKVFLYLYPIEEYPGIYLFPKEFYQRHNFEMPFEALNECIDKRYRQNGYEIYCALYPDKELYGIIKKERDKIVYTDVEFYDAIVINQDGTDKPLEKVKYPNELLIAKQIGDVDEIVIGGYHFQDCVKRYANAFTDLGIKTLVDLELTDLFFYLYRQDYFVKNNYDPNRYKDFIIKKSSDKLDEEEVLKMFVKKYSESYYGFNNSDVKTKTN